MSSAAESTWYVFRDGQQFGPLSDENLRDLIQDKKLNKDDYIWCQGYSDWVRLGSVLTAISAPGVSSRFSYLRSFIRFVSRSAAEPISLAKKIAQIISRPSAFADVYIKDEPRALFASIKFYLKLFALTFAVYLIAGRFKLYEGESQIRDLVKLVPQLAIGFLLLFVLLRIVRNRVPVSSLLQSILYVDGVYLLFDAVAGMAFSYLKLTLLVPEGSLREIDLFDTEFEKCVSNESFAYWLIRGDLQFFLYNDKWSPSAWPQWLLSNYGYITMLPFAFIFARMVNWKFKVNFVVVLLAAICAFVTAWDGYRWVEQQAGSTLAARSNCGQTYVKAVLSTYSAERIARQLEFKLTNELQRHFANPDIVVRLERNEYVF